MLASQIDKPLSESLFGHLSTDDLRANGTPNEPTEIVSCLRPGHRVADVGCFGWTLQKQCLERKIHLTGFDQTQPRGRFGETCFQYIRNGKLESPDQMFHLVIASHVLEHTHDCVGMMGEIARILVPGGVAWVECPSELSCTPLGSDDPTSHDFVSFWDDPTHTRPHTPASFYRLAIAAQLAPMQIGRTVSGGIPCVRMVARKPMSTGKPTTRYVGLKGIKRGMRNAYNAIWPETPLV